MCVQEMRRTKGCVVEEEIDVWGCIVDGTGVKREQGEHETT